MHKENTKTSIKKMVRTRNILAAGQQCYELRHCVVCKTGIVQLNRSKDLFIFRLITLKTFHFSYPLCCLSLCHDVDRNVCKKNSFIAQVIGSLTGRRAESERKGRSAVNSPL